MSAFLTELYSLPRKYKSTFTVEEKNQAMNWRKKWMLLEAEHFVGKKVDFFITCDGTQVSKITCDLIGVG